MNNKAIGARVKKLRTEMGFTTTTLAEKVGISQAQISRLENGRQGFRSTTLSKIAAVLGVKEVYFFDDDPNAQAILPEQQGDPVLLRAIKCPPCAKLLRKLANAYFENRRWFKVLDVVVSRILCYSKPDVRALLQVLKNGKGK